MIERIGYTVNFIKKELNIWYDKDNRPTNSGEPYSIFVELKDAEKFISKLLMPEYHFIHRVKYIKSFQESLSKNLDLADKIMYLEKL